MALFEVPVEETVTRRFVMHVEARDPGEARRLAERHACPGTGARRGLTEEILRKTAKNGVLSCEAEATRPSDIVWTSDSDVRALPGPIQSSELVIFPESFTAHWRGVPLALTRAQFLVLLKLVLMEGRTADRETLLFAHARDAYEAYDRTVDTYVRRIREAFRAVDPTFECIQTCYGTGYRWVAAAGQAAPSVPARPGAAALLQVDLHRGEVFLDRERLPVRRGQFLLLAAMARRPERVLTHDEVRQYGCPRVAEGAAAYGAVRSLIKTIRNLARAVRPDIDLFETQYGIGTRISPDIQVAVHT